MNKKTSVSLTSYSQTRWSKVIDRDVAKLSASEVAERYGISPRAVRTRRKKLGIPANETTPSIRWTAKRDALIGAMPDTELAEKLATTKFLVRKRRIEKGIAAFVPEEAPEAQYDRRPPHNWPVHSERASAQD